MDSTYQDIKRIPERVNTNLSDYHAMSVIQTELVKFISQKKDAELANGKVGEGVNMLLPSVPFLYPLKTSGNLRFSDVFRGYKKGTLGTNGLMILCHQYCRLFLICHS